MASGITLEMREFSKTYTKGRFNWKPTYRDRSLAGKKRVKARKLENKDR